MTAVLSHELRNHFHSLTAWVFGAFLLLVIGLGALMYNLQEAVSNFEYVLGFGCLVFVVMVPILTMRTIAEERKQKTDQLLYALPITTTDVILGKYLSLLAVYLVPLGIISVYPLIFARYGEVYFPTAYGSIFAFFLLGAALIAVGIFLSSLTENQGLAAGMGIAVILLNYYSVDLAEYAAATAVGSAIALFALAMGLGILVKHLTQNENWGYSVGLSLMAVNCAAFWWKPELFEGLVPEIMSELSLFARFYRFIDGVFDLTAVVYFGTVIAFFLFLSVQSLEKRRYN